MTHATRIWYSDQQNCYLLLFWSILSSTTFLRLLHQIQSKQQQIFLLLLSELSGLSIEKMFCMKKVEMLRRCKMFIFELII